MMFTWLQSNAMEIVWERGSWTEQDINRIVTLSDEEVIQYWKAFWSQLKPDDIFDQVKDSFEIRSYGDCKDDFYRFIAEKLDKRLRYCNFHNKKRLALGKAVLNGPLSEQDMFLCVAPLFIPEELKFMCASSEETVSSDMSDAVEDNGYEESQEQSVLSNGSQNFFESEDSFFEGISQQPDTSGPTLGGSPQNFPQDNGIFTATLSTMSAHLLPTLAGVIVVSSACCWVYKKYQGYKMAQKKSDQIEQSENEATETD